MFDGRPDRARWSGPQLVLPELRIHLIELPHLAIGSPPQVAVPGVSQVEMRYFIEATGRVEARSKFVGERLIVNKAVCASRADGLFVEALGVQFALFQTREFGANQCRPICERCRTIVCPDRYLLEMRCQCFHMSGPLLGRRHIATGRSRKRRVKMILSELELRRRRPKHRRSF